MDLKFSVLSFFFFFLINFNVINQTKGTAKGKSAIQAETNSKGRLSLLKHKDTLDLRANLAAACAAELLDLLTQLTKQEKKDSLTVRMFLIILEMDQTGRTLGSESESMQTLESPSRITCFQPSREASWAAQSKAAASA